MAVSREVILRELRELRKREGISSTRVADSPQIMEAIATATGNGVKFSPSDAKGVILTLVDEIVSDRLAAQALRHALGGTKGSARTLTERRQSFADSQERHPDTIENWENAAIDVVAQVLSNPTLNFASGGLVKSDEHPPLDVFADVVGNRTTKISVRGLLGLPPQQIIETRVNRVSGPSLPVHMYQLMPGMRPSELMLAVVFLKEAPASIWATAGRNLHDIMFSTKRKELNLDEHQRTHIAFRNPEEGVTYAICWSWLDITAR